jgi:hypothetical protein
MLQFKCKNGVTSIKKIDIMHVINTSKIMVVCARFGVVLNNESVLSHGSIVLGPLRFRCHIERLERVIPMRFSERSRYLGRQKLSAFPALLAIFVITPVGASQMPS